MKHQSSSRRRVRGDDGSAHAPRLLYCWTARAYHIEGLFHRTQSYQWSRTMVGYHLPLMAQEVTAALFRYLALMIMRCGTPFILRYARVG